jgi:hypothetical protein
VLYFAFKDFKARIEFSMLVLWLLFLTANQPKTAASPCGVKTSPVISGSANQRREGYKSRAQHSTEKSCCVLMLRGA